MASVRVTRDDDLADLSCRLRAADLKELDAHQATPEMALELGFRFSAPCLTIEHEGRAIGMFGVTPNKDVDRVGHVWLLGSDEISDITVQFLRESRGWLTEFGKDYGFLWNVVHDENELHHKWLKFMGFKFLNHRPPFFEVARFC